MSGSGKYWVAENGVALQLRQPHEGGVDRDRLELLVRDVFGKNIPGGLTVLELSEDGNRWRNIGLFEAFTAEK